MSIDSNGPDAPSFRLLTEEKLRALHDGAVRVLADVGIEVAHERAREMLLSAGATLEGEMLIKVPRELVDDSIASAPSM